MHDSQFSWLPYLSPDASDIIKVEPMPEVSLLSPPTSPFLPNTHFAAESETLCRRRSTPLLSPKRIRPYPATRAHRPRPEDNMATGHYNSRGQRQTTERRSSEGDEPVSYNAAGFVSSQYVHRPTSGNRPSTSSLTGAMGDTHISGPQRASRSPPPPRSGAYSLMSLGQQGVWQENPSSSLMAPQSSVFGDSAYPHPVSEVASTYRATPSDPSLTPPTPFPPFHDPYVQGMNDPGSENEVLQLRRKVHNLEVMVKMLENELGRAQSSGQSSSGHGSPMSTPPHSAAFQASWKARTDARIRQFCSLNRAGNALCSWHDSRRERRMYPPRMAPPGLLNCGCTYEEALFEESLSRHGVGSYHPGESVRMDPALRNPLLKLLQDRYGYRDGDFERDPLTGDWIPGEGPAHWEQQIQAGVVNPRKPRHDNDRR